MKIQMGDVAHTSATLMHHIGTQGDLWKELYEIANSKDKGWLELTRDIGELAIAYETHWFECAEVVQDEFEWLGGILEISVIIADHYKNDIPLLETVKEACERSKVKR